MKKFIVMVMLAAVVSAADLAAVASGSNPQTDNSIVVAQRYCPNGRC